MANRAQVQTVTNKSYNSQWDNRMGVMTQLQSDPGYPDEAQTKFTYDSAGRELGDAFNSCVQGTCNTTTTTEHGTFIRL